VNEHTTKPNVKYLLNYLRANEDDVADSFFCGIEDLEQPMTILAATPDLLDACKLARDALDPNCDCNEPEDLDAAYQACFEAVVKSEVTK